MRFLVNFNRFEIHFLLPKPLLGGGILDFCRRMRFDRVMMGRTPVRILTDDESRFNVDLDEVIVAKT